MFQLGPQDRYVLMRKDVAVCSFSYNLRQRSVSQLGVHSDRDAPWGASTTEAGIDSTQLAW